MFGIALVLPFAYTTVLAVKRILLNKSVSSIMKHLLMMINREREHYQTNDNEGDPLLHHLANNQGV